MIPSGAMVAQLGGCYEIGGCRLLSSSAPGVHHGEGKILSLPFHPHPTPARVFNSAATGDGGADHQSSLTGGRAAILSLGGPNEVG